MDKLTELLGGLADKLGTTVEQLWGYWVPYCVAVVRADIVIATVWLVLGAATSTILVTCFIRWVKRAKPFDVVDGELPVMISFLIAIPGFVALMGFTQALRSIIIALNAPAGYAMKQLIAELR